MAAAVLLHHHDLVGRLGAPQRGQQVEVDDRLDEARRRLGRQHVGRAAGVVDQHVEPAEVLDRLGDDPFGVRPACARRPSTNTAPSTSASWRPQVTTCAPAAGEGGHDPGPDPTRTARHHDHALAEVEDGLGHGANPTAPPGTAARARPGRRPLHRVGPAARAGLSSQRLSDAASGPRPRRARRPMPIDVVQEHDGIAEVVIDHPPVNALDVAGWFALADALIAAGRVPTNRVVVLRADRAGLLRRRRHQGDQRQG